MVSTELISITESVNHNIELWIMPKEMDMLEELLKIFYMIQVEVPLLLKFNSTILIDIKKTKFYLLLLKECIMDNFCIVEIKLKLPSETFYQLTKYQKVPLYQMLKPNGVIEELSQKPLEPTAQLLDTLMMESKPDSDYHLDKEKPSLENAELPLESLPEEEEPINPCSKPEISSINSKERERCGQSPEVLS